MARASWLAGLARIGIGLGAGAAAAAFGIGKAEQRLRLSRAKHRSLTGHVRMARRVAGWLPGYDLDRDAFFRADGASDEQVARREAGFARLSALYRERYARTAALTAEMQGSIPDIDFISRYRVPFPFSRMVREALPSGSFYQASDGLMLTDLDGNRFYDLTGSYGVNLLGTDASVSYTHLTLPTNREV